MRLFDRIDYFVKQSNLPGKRCVGEIDYRKTVDLDEILRQVRREGGVLISSEMEAALKNVFTIILDNLREGNKVNLPWMQLYLGMQGEFENEDSSFDPAKHELVLKMRTGTKWKRAIQGTKMHKVRKPGVARPHIWQVSGYQEDNIEQVVAGQMLILKGANLKTRDVKDERQGVFFVSHDMPEPLRIPELFTNTMKQVRFIVPAHLPAGEYEIILRSTVHAGNKSLRDNFPYKKIRVIRPKP